MVGNGPALDGPVADEKAIRLRAVFESSNDVCCAVYETGSILLCALLCFCCDVTSLNTVAATSLAL